MAYITKADLATHLYAEIIEEISRANDGTVDACIAEAEAEAKSYCSRYKIATLFSADVVDANLKSKVKDITAWKLVRLANPNISITLLRTMYEDAIAWFEKVQAGEVVPHGWPYAEDDSETPGKEGSSVTYSSNRKRSNHY